MRHIGLIVLAVILMFFSDICRNQGFNGVGSILILVSTIFVGISFIEFVETKNKRKDEKDTSI